MWSIDKISLALLMTIISLAKCYAQEPTMARDLGASCLVICQVLHDQPTLMTELGQNDRCTGYLKAVAGGIEWFNKRNSPKIDVGSCTKKLLANRTATRPQDDDLTIQSCALGSWISDRPAIGGLPAVKVVVNWMKVTRCE